MATMCFGTHLSITVTATVKKRMIYRLLIAGSRCTSLSEAQPTFRLLQLAAKLTVRASGC